MNKIQLVGRITKDVELQTTMNGIDYVRFNVSNYHSGRIVIDTSKIALDIINFVIAKVIKNDKTIIAFFKNVVTGEIIKTKATCQEEDEFDLQTGVKICTAKFYIRYYKKYLHKIDK